jgi:hypothetical protein
MRTQITLLRQQLAQQILTRGVDDPQVEHLRWQIASLERQERWREDSAGMLGAPSRAGSVARTAGRERGR